MAWLLYTVEEEEYEELERSQHFCDAFEDQHRSRDSSQRRSRSPSVYGRRAKCRKLSGPWCFYPEAQAAHSRAAEVDADSVKDSPVVADEAKADAVSHTDKDAEADNCYSGRNSKDHDDLVTDYTSNSAADDGNCREKSDHNHSRMKMPSGSSLPKDRGKGGRADFCDSSRLRRSLYHRPRRRNYSTFDDCDETSSSFANKKKSLFYSNKNETRFFEELPAEPQSTTLRNDSTEKLLVQLAKRLLCCMLSLLLNLVLSPLAAGASHRIKRTASLFNLASKGRTTTTHQTSLPRMLKHNRKNSVIIYAPQFVPLVYLTALFWFCLKPVQAQLGLGVRGLLGEYYELDYENDDLPCNLESLEDAFLGQVPTVQTTEVDGMEIQKLTPENCKWNLIERTDRYPEVFYPTVEEARVDLGFRRDHRDQKYYIDYILYPKQQPPGSPLRDREGFASAAYLRLGYRLLAVNGDEQEFELRTEILSRNVFGDTDPIHMKFQAFRLEYFCSGTITFQANFFGVLSGDLQIRNPGRYDFRLTSTAAQVNFMMGHDHCKGGDRFGYNDGACGPRSRIQNLKMSSLQQHMSGAIGTECRVQGADTTVCQDPLYPSRIPAGDICFNTENGCEPFSIYAMHIPDIKCDSDKVTNQGATPHPRTIERFRWMRAGFHPLRITIARRFKVYSFENVDFALQYKGPDTTPVKTVIGAVFHNCTGADQDYFSVQSSTTRFATARGDFKYEFTNDGHWMLINTNLVDRNKCKVRGTPLRQLGITTDDDSHMLFKYRWAGYSPGAELYDFPWRQDIRDVDGNLVTRDIEFGIGVQLVNTPELIADPNLPELQIFHGYQWTTVPGNAYVPLNEPKWQADWWGPIERSYDFMFPDYIYTTRAQERRTQTFGEKFFNQHVTVQRVDQIGSSRQLRRELGLEEKDDKGDHIKLQTRRVPLANKKMLKIPRASAAGKLDDEQEKRQLAREYFWKLLGLSEKNKDRMRGRSVVLDYDARIVKDEEVEGNYVDRALKPKEQDNLASTKSAAAAAREQGEGEMTGENKHWQLTEEQFRDFFDRQLAGKEKLDVFNLPRYTEKEFAEMKRKDRELAEKQRKEMARGQRQEKRNENGEAERTKTPEDLAAEEVRKMQKKEFKEISDHPDDRTLFEADDPWWGYLRNPSTFLKRTPVMRNTYTGTFGPAKKTGSDDSKNDKAGDPAPAPHAEKASSLPQINAKNKILNNENKEKTKTDQETSTRGLQAEPDQVAIVVTDPPNWKTLAPTTTTTTTPLVITSTSTKAPTTTPPPLNADEPKYYGRTFHEILFFVTPFHPEVQLDGKPMVRLANWPNQHPWSRDTGTDVSDPIPIPDFDYTKPYAARFTGVVNFERPGNYTIRVETDAMFQMFFGGRGLSSEVVLQKLTNEPLQKRLETRKQVYLAGNHYIRLEMLTRNRDKMLWVTYEGPDTVYYESAAEPNRIIGYARPSIYRGNIHDHEIGITHPYVDGLRSSSLECRLIASKEGGVQLPRDCANRCTDQGLLDGMSSGMMRDGTCDDGTVSNGFNLFCPEWTYDGGDCDPPLPSDEKDPPIECLVTPPAGHYRRYGYTQCDRTETRGFNYFYDASDNRVIPSPLPDIPNPRETEEIFCVSDYDFFPEMPTYSLAHWPATTTTTTTTYNPNNPFVDPNPKFTKCCVAQVQNDPEHGSYCLAYGAPVGCFQTMQEIKQRRLKWLRDSPEYSEKQLNTYFAQNGDLNVTELVQCTTPKCNSLPGDFTVDRRGERIYKCPWQKDPDDIADLFQTQQKQKSIFCYETRERDIFPPLICQNREFTSYNFCQNDRTREGRRYAHCCVTTYVEADTNRFVCKLTGLPLNYPGRCNSFLNRHISVLNALRPQALNPRVWSQCGAGDLCNEPELYNCPVVYDQNAEAAANAKANPYVPPLPPVYGEEDFSPVAQIMIIAGLLFCVVMPITVHYLRKKYLKVYEPEFVQDLYVEPEFGEGILRNNVFNKIRPGAGFFKTMIEKYRPKELTDEQRRAIQEREEAAQEIQPYVTKYSRAISQSKQAKKSGEPIVDEYTQAILDEIARKDEEAQAQQRVELEVAERERVAKDPANAFSRARPAYHETLTEFSQRTGTVPLALQNQLERIKNASSVASLQNSDGFSQMRGGMGMLETGPSDTFMSTDSGVPGGAVYSPGDVQVQEGPPLAGGSTAASATQVAPEVGEQHQPQQPPVPGTVVSETDPAAVTTAVPTMTEGEAQPRGGPQQLQPDNSDGNIIPGLLPDNVLSQRFPHMKGGPVISEEEKERLLAAAEERSMNFDRNKFVQYVPYKGDEHNELERTSWRARNEEGIRQRGGILTEDEKAALHDIWNEAHSPKHERAASRGGSRMMQPGTGGGGLLGLLDASQQSHDRSLMQLEDRQSPGGGKKMQRKRTGLLDEDDTQVRVPGDDNVREGDVIPGNAFQGMAPPVVMPAAVSKALRKKKFNGKVVT